MHVAFMQPPLQLHPPEELEALMPVPDELPTVVVDAPVLVVDAPVLAVDAPVEAALLVAPPAPPLPGCSPLSPERSWQPPATVAVIIAARPQR
jgi:hypothetical protein